MSVQGIGGGGSPSAIAALKLALRQAQPGGTSGASGGSGSSGAVGGSAGSAPELMAPEALLRDIVGRAQFMASLRAASAAVEQVGTLLQTFDGGEPAAQR